MPQFFGLLEFELAAAGQDALSATAEQAICLWRVRAKIECEWSMGRAAVERERDGGDRDRDSSVTAIAAAVIG